jgi:UDP-glucose 4-epimerase
MSSINLLKAMDANNVTHMIFSSTAALYGEPAVRVFNPLWMSIRV